MNLVHNNYVLWRSPASQIQYGGFIGAVDEKNVGINVY